MLGERGQGCRGAGAQGHGCSRQERLDSFYGLRSWGRGLGRSVTCHLSRTPEHGRSCGERAVGNGGDGEAGVEADCWEGEDPKTSLGCRS